MSHLWVLLLIGLPICALGGLSLHLFLLLRKTRAELKEAAIYANKTARAAARAIYLDVDIITTLLEQGIIPTTEMVRAAQEPLEENFETKD